MNAPDRFELFTLPPGEKKLTYTKDTKIANAGSFLVQKEDHTLGNLLRMQLHRDKDVLFAGYRVPHPLEHSIIVKIQTTPITRPETVLDTAITDLLQECSILEEKFKNELARKKNAYI